MKIFLALVAMMADLISIVKKVEELYPEAGQGKAKMALLVNMLVAAYEGVSEMLPQIEAIVGVIVSFCNKMGIFKTSESEG